MRVIHSIYWIAFTVFVFVLAVYGYFQAVYAYMYYTAPMSWESRPTEIHVSAYVQRYLQVEEPHSMRSMVVKHQRELVR